MRAALGAARSALISKRGHQMLRHVGEHRVCDHHDRLAELLHAEDAIVTFNYDCLMDVALRRKAGRGWDPTRSYAFEIQESAAAAWRLDAPRRRPVKAPIALLKLHVSLN